MSDPTAACPFPVRRVDPFAPPPEYEQWRREGPVKLVQFPNGQRVWAITQHAAIREALGQHDLEDLTSNRFDPLFPKLRAGVGGTSTDSNLLYMDEPEHGRIRRMLSPLFTHKKAAVMRPGIQDSVDRVIDEMVAAGGSHADLHTAFSLPIPSLVICQLLGVSYGDHDFFQSITDKLLSRDTTPEQFQELLARLHSYLVKVVAEKDNAPSEDDLIGHLILKNVRQGELTHEQVVGLSMLMLIAGHETTATTISLGVLHFLTTGVWRELVVDPGRAAKVVDETIRIQAINDNTKLRLAVNDFELAGCPIRAGEGIVALSASANHDPAVFPDPATIDPERDARTHLGFGHGVHVCLGQNLARVELDIAYSTLARRLPSLQIDQPLEEIDFKHDGFVFGLRSLPVRW